MADRAVSYAIESLASAHDRAAFKSGVVPLDRYFTNQATQDIRRRVSACFVAVEDGAKAVAGYYTIAMTSIPLSDIAPATAKKLPRYPLVPAARIGRLAVAEGHRGKGLGAALLVDAIKRALQTKNMAFAVVVDAKDDTAVAFYRHHGFIAFASAPMSLYLPLAEAARQFDISTS